MNRLNMCWHIQRLHKRMALFATRPGKLHYLTSVMRMLIIMCRNYQTRTKIKTKGKTAGRACTFFENIWNDLPKWRHISTRFLPHFNSRGFPLFSCSLQACPNLMHKHNQTLQSLVKTLKIYVHLLFQKLQQAIERI